MHEHEVRVCRICGTEKPASEFYHRENGVLRKECKDCKKDLIRFKATGWSPDAYEMAFAKQGGKCGICRTELNSSRYSRFAGDHCHKTGRLRGLLCTNCNTALGLMKDSTGRLLAAVAYLEAHTEGKEIVSSREKS